MLDDSLSQAKTTLADLGAKNNVEVHFLKTKFQTSSSTKFTDNRAYKKR